MLTIFACPKPFTDPHIAVIQRNAITSWTLLQPRPEIILFGDEPGVAEICAELGLRHARQIARNEYGTPLVNHIFEKADQVASHSLLCYVNSDIILPSNFMNAICTVMKLERFLLVGQRVTLSIRHAIDFGDRQWAEPLLFQAREKHLLDGARAIDYFAFRRGLFQKMPAFALGKFAWDNWMIWKALSENVPVVDATTVVSAIHQAHGYPHPDGWQGIVKGEETRRNHALTANGKHQLTLLDATHTLTPSGIQSRWAIRTRYHLKKRFRAWIGPPTRPLRRKFGSHLRILFPIRF